MDIRKISKVFEYTKPRKLGNKLLILATAPEVKPFFEDESIRKRFEDYDIAVINRMPLCSEAEMHLIKPKYIVFSDSVFYDDHLENGDINERKILVEQVLGRVDWECNVVVPVWASYSIDNSFIHYIKLSILNLDYNVLTRPLYNRNLANFGFNNVVMGAIYFGITFGYRDIAIMGFTYRNGEMYMDEDGLHTSSYPHYYDECTYPEVVGYDKLFDGKESYLLKRAKRAVESEYKLCELARYAHDMGVDVVNYTPRNCVDVFRTERL